MKAVFADTSFYIALTNERDGRHAQAQAVADNLHIQTITTDYVLIEVGNWMSRSGDRPAFLRLLDQLLSDAYTTIVPATRELLVNGLDLYRRRPDKDWSVTDCISYVVMEDHGITEALTADRHFEQAGFTILLK